MRKPVRLDKAVRRSRIYRGRVLRMVTRKTLSSPCAFMHIPKCGGTSLSEALYSLVPLDQKVGILDSPSIRRALGIYYGEATGAPLHDEMDDAARLAAFREQLLIMHMAHDCRLIHGHFLFSEKADAVFGRDYKYVTMMREPVARTISNYRMAHRTGNFAGSLSDFAQSAMGRRMASHFLRYFSGVADPAENEGEALMERAKANMRKFAVIGFIEDQPAFLRRFRAAFGSQPVIEHYNKATEDRVAVSAGERRAIEALCAADIALFDFARTLA